MLLLRVTRGERATAAIHSLLAGLAFWTAAAIAQERAPLRVDNWAYYQRNTDDSERWQYRLRAFAPFDLGGGWTFTQRADLIFYYTDRKGPENPAGEWAAGAGDWFVEESFATPELAKNLKGVLGARFVFPTGGLSPFGSGQYQWAPVLGLTYTMPGRGLTLAPLARYFMSYHAAETAAGQVRRLDFYPTASQRFGEDWTFSAWNENPISYNDVTRKWFVPLDAMLIKRVRKDVEFGVGAAYGLVRDDPQYLSQVYGRLTFYF